MVLTRRTEEGQNSYLEFVVVQASFFRMFAA